MHRSRILITGGAGYVGGYLVDLLEEKGHMVTVYDNLLYEDRYLKPVHFIYGDIRDTKKLESIIPDYDVVIWLAAIVGDGACAVDKNLTAQVNSQTVKWLVDTFPDKKIVFPSTCSVYGANSELVDESSEPNPLSVYAETKLEAERYIVDHHNNYLIFRLGTLFGMSDTYSRVRLDLVSNILSMRAALNEPLQVFGGEQWRPLLHVKDVAHGILYCLNRGITGLYNISFGNYTIKDIAEQIRNVWPITKVEYQDIQFEDRRDYKVSTAALNRTGFEPRLTMRKGIEEMIKVFSEKRLTNPQDDVYSNVAYLNKLKQTGKF